MRRMLPSFAEAAASSSAFLAVVDELPPGHPGPRQSDRGERSGEASPSRNAASPERPIANAENAGVDTMLERNDGTKRSSAGGIQALIPTPQVSVGTLGNKSSAFARDGASIVTTATVVATMKDVVLRATGLRFETSSTCAAVAVRDACDDSELNFAQRSRARGIVLALSRNPDR